MLMVEYQKDTSALHCEMHRTVTQVKLHSTSRDAIHHQGEKTIKQKPKTCWKTHNGPIRQIGLKYINK